MELNTNLLGRIFGTKGIELSGETLHVNTRSGEHKSYNLSRLRSFATITESLFGSSLSIDFSDEKLTIKYLRKSEISEFVDGLNSFISKKIEEYLSQATSEFNSLVIKSYPRDSWLNQISDLCEELHSHYLNQSDLWEKYLPSDLAKQTKDIAKHHPVDAPALRKAHEAYQLAKRKDFFDVVESNPLTEEQRLGVLRSNDKNMVLAAAGTGKTSVMVAKALDLIDRGLAKPSEILILAYNRAAALELNERFLDKAGKSKIVLETSPQISTFHALGRQLLREAGIPTNMSVYTEDPFRLTQWVTNWIYSYIAEDPTRIFDLIELSNPPIDPFDFKSKADYEKHLRDNEFRTLNNEKVKGYQELLIANFLYMNKIPYVYEAPYITKKRIDIGFDYKPDFHLTEADIYIEHFGIDRKGNTRPDIDAKAYNESITKKRALHKEYGTTLVETFHYEWTEDNLTQSLKTKLLQHGVQCEPMHPSEIFEKLNQQNKLSSWSELMTKALQAIRVERLDKETIFKRLEDSKINQPKKYSGLLDALHQGYVEELQNHNSIDFDDMIIRAIEVLQKEEYIPTWKYVLVDEFQDISEARMGFLKALIEKGPSPSLTVVGDDWQSIYRFSGGKLELTTRFDQLVGPYTMTKLQKTFRYNNSIANTAGNFIMTNPEQYEKHIKTHTTVDQSQVYLLDDKQGIQNGLYVRVKEVIDKIRENDSSASISIIARYNYLLEESKKFLWAEGLKENINYWSFHKSKGLEADYCILIGFFQGKSGFPNENRDDAIIAALLPALDTFPHSEERRLLYVGITRAKKKCYIIADPYSPSDFVTELLAPIYDLNVHSPSFQAQRRAIFKCPNCEDGFFRRIEGKLGAFYSCSTGLGCRVGKARICKKCGAPSVDTRYASICNNASCGQEMKICDKCGRPMKKRNGKYGEFWGCSGFGIKEDQCKNTEKI
ncbi:UvrD-helicase domain-containing protein [Marinomonas fungiae]|uniref:UvrD-like helicase C-terminal domain/Topoisomerase DNA binding C4 zinc finger/UvrD/REP helicase N-terminal domain n=1 Tax=Marinomonas fungiae TaxID=1137284 RepID=A0A0K6IU67_9GAMM|nr:UvrD-helicase domain-containing protein [Marinomonas fungiae]CUB06656.1 UvrD-like helicase C-terminal domain/Topoisomerase DNA binding C4 zinc finger/UvrD/REP helicase N-terminal domain [Marinomonas fungiae]